MFLDTSGLLAIVDRSDEWHGPAVLYYRRARRRLLHSYVLAELFAPGTSRRVARTVILDLDRDLSSAPEVQLVWVEESLHREAADLLAARLDKTYSLCEAVSFVLMQRSGVRCALTADRHFEQEGFTRLLA